MPAGRRSGRGDPISRHTPVARGRLVPGVRNPPAPGLTSRNRHVADGRKVHGRADQQGRVNVGQGSHRWRSQVSAAVGPGTVNLHHFGLELIPLRLGQTGLHDRRLILKPIPVIRHHVAIIEPRLERARRGTRTRPDGVIGHRVGPGCRRGGAAVKAHACELRSRRHRRRGNRRPHPSLKLVVFRHHDCGRPVGKLGVGHLIGPPLVAPSRRVGGVKAHRRPHGHGHAGTRLAQRRTPHPPTKRAAGESL